MTQMTGNGHPRVIEAIEHAVDLDSKGQTALAVQHLSALITEFPAAASLQSYLAWLLSRSGHVNEAIHHGRQAILLSPTSEKASFVLFQVLWKSGQRIEALDEMKRFLALRPSKEYSEMIGGWELEAGDEDTHGT
jgi:predicted Zn-dependent protease